MSRKYHGWLVLVPQGTGMNDAVRAEYMNAGGKRDCKDFGYGERGCVRCIEWFDKRAGKPVKLEVALKGMHRVYTEEATEPTLVWVLEQITSDGEWELLDVYATLDAAKAALKGDPELIWCVEGDDRRTEADGRVYATNAHDEPQFYLTRMEVKS